MLLVKSGHKGSGLESGVASLRVMGEVVCRQRWRGGLSGQLRLPKAG